MTVGGSQLSFLPYERIGHSFKPEEVSELQTVFDEVCKECSEPKDSGRSQQTAAVLIRSFERGIEDPALLADIGRAVMRSLP